MNWIRLASLFAVAALASCSLTLDGPPRYPGRTPPACDRSKALVVADGLAATGLGVTGLTLMANQSSTAGSILVAAGAVFALAAGSGNGKVDRCREAHLAYAGELSRNQPLPVSVPNRPLATPPVAAVSPTIPPVAPVGPPPVAAPTPPVAQPSPVVSPKPASRWDEFWKEQP